jgi:hypothetical protein
MKSIAELKERLRKTFRDEYNIQWSDALLDEILYEAEREYAFYSGGLVDTCEIVSTGSAVCYLPDDFFQVVKITGTDGRDIPAVSYRKLIEDHGDFRNDKGNSPLAVCFNFDNFGQFRVYPVLPPGTKIGTITYKRIPREGENISLNSEAVEQYALFMMYSLTGKAMAQNCYAAFMDAIHKEQKQKLSSGSKNIARTGVYY